MPKHLNCHPNHLHPYRRLPEPRKFLESLPRLLKPGGVAVIISPYSWLQEYTAQEHWLGGLVRGGDSVASAEALAEAMAALGFALVEQFDMPFLIREHGACTMTSLKRTCANAHMRLLRSAQVPVGLQPRHGVAPRQRRVRVIGLCGLAWRAASGAHCILHFVLSCVVVAALA